MLVSKRITTFPLMNSMSSLVSVRKLTNASTLLIVSFYRPCKPNRWLEHSLSGCSIFGPTYNLTKLLIQFIKECRPFTFKSDYETAKVSSQSCTMLDDKKEQVMHYHLGRLWIAGPYYHIPHSIKNERTMLKMLFRLA